MSADRYAQAKQLFLRALELEAGQRADFVDQACGRDEPLRSEVMSLLRHHDTRTLLEIPQDDTAVEPPGSRLRPSSFLGPAARQVSPQASRSVPSRTSRTLWKMSRSLNPGGHLALGILLGTLLVLVVGYLTSQTAIRSIREVRIQILSNVLDTNVRALNLWIEQEKERVRIGVRHAELRSVIEQLVQAAASEKSSTELRDSPLHAALRAEVRESFAPDSPDVPESPDAPSIRYAVWDRRHVTIADWSLQGTGIGEGVTPYGALVLQRVFDGETVIQMPGLREPITKGYPILRGAATIGILTPVRDTQGKIIAAILVYGLGAEDRFHDVLSILNLGISGEMYAFDQQGLMISNSRFDKDLKQLGLIANQPGAQSSLIVHVRDPGRDLPLDPRRQVDQNAWPLTWMARHAVAGQDGANATGYNDYRGVRVIGAWRWLNDHQFGVAAEVDYAEAFRDFRVVQAVMGALYGLFVTSVACVVWSYLAVRRAKRQLGEARRLGPYTLERLIGEGGMGQVYLARHTLLKRPTAVKLLRPEVACPVTLEWFEREVQLASQLTHPNTIEIYDYGHTEENVFYYAMEYLSGLTLEELVRRCGPLPPARAAHLLRQIALSLREAHASGLIHRDIKPQNIMVCRRGGESDVVKVLDFGLAKDAAAGPAEASTATFSLAGTPLYMAPERFEDPLSVDARVDIYAWGAVAFKLLTGQDLFDTSNPAQLLASTLSRPPDRPSERLGKPLPKGLDELVTACLAKRPELRPANIKVVLEQLAAIPFDTPWDPSLADAWWNEFVTA